MASLTEEIADALARDAIRAAEELGDENLVTEISRLIGASSTTTQEAFNTAVRVRQSEARARRLLADRLGASWPLEATRAAPAPVVAPQPVMSAPGPSVAPVVLAPAPQPVASAPAAVPQAAASAPGSAVAAVPKPAPQPQAAAAPAVQTPASSGATARQAVLGPVGLTTEARSAEPARASAPPVRRDDAPVVQRGATPADPRQSAPETVRPAAPPPVRQEPVAPRPLAQPGPSSPARPPGLSEEAAPAPFAVPTRPPKPDYHPIETPPPASPTQSFAAKLALASALPRRTVTPAEPRNLLPPRSDDEIPDGDWG